MWKLRSEVSELLEELGLVKQSLAEQSILDDIRNAEIRLSGDKYREAVIQARVGQGQFRKNQINYWQSCAVTGFSETSLLIASHIKPWSESSISEALSVTNGLLLTPNLDKVFDKGYISFDSSGKIMISDMLSGDGLEVFGINKNMKIRTNKFSSEHKEFMCFHNDKVFKGDC